jgi:flavodoxin
MKILVTGYSRSGFTKRLGDEIAAACSADQEFIEDGVERDTVVGYVRSALEAALHWRPTIFAPLYLPISYDWVIIGTPVWFWNISSPVRAYVERYQGQFKRVAFFCSYDGSGQQKVLRDLQGLVGESPVATLAITHDRIRRKRHQGDVAAFLEKIKNSNGSRRASPAGARRKRTVQAVPSH